MGQFSVKNNFWFSIFSYPWTWDVSLPPTVSILCKFRVSVSVYVCMTNKDITNLERQASLNLVSPSLPFFCTHHALHAIESESYSKCHKTKINSIKHTIFTRLAFSEYWFYLENTSFPIPYSCSYQPLQFRPVMRFPCFFALLYCYEVNVCISPKSTPPHLIILKP